MSDGRSRARRRRGLIRDMLRSYVEGILANIVHHIPLLSILVLFISVLDLRSGVTTDLVDLRVLFASNQDVLLCQIPFASSLWKTGYPNPSPRLSTRPQPQTSPSHRACSMFPCISGDLWYDEW